MCAAIAETKEDSCQCFGGSLLVCQRVMQLPFASEAFCSKATHLMILDADEGSDIPAGAAIDQWLPNLTRVDVEGLGDACRKAIHGARNYIVICHAKPMLERRRSKRRVGGMEMGLMGLSGASLTAQLSLIIAGYRIYRNNIQPFFTPSVSSPSSRSD